MPRAMCGIASLAHESRATHSAIADAAGISTEAARFPDAFHVMREERMPETPRGPGWSGQPRRGNTARTDAGLRAGARTGLGDCQSKGWPRRQRCAGSPCQTLSPCSSGQPDPQSSTSLAPKTAITSLCHPCPCPPGVAAPCRDGLSIQGHSGHGPHQWLITISRHCRSAS